MAKYAENGSRACGATVKTVLSLKASTLTRGRLYQIVIGASGTPADNALQWILQRFTAAGTGSAVTPTALDPGEPAAQCSSDENHSAEPTYTAGAVPFEISLHQKATLLWQAAPGAEIVIPATTANGVGMGTSHASFTGNVDTSFHHDE